MTNGPAVPSARKKGLSPLAWVGIGCLGLLVMGGVAAVVVGVFVVGKVKDVARQVEEDPIAATARLLAAANPDVELVEADKDARTVTFRDKKSGREFTFSYEDIQQGRVTFSSGGETAEIAVDPDAGEGGQLTVRTSEGTATFGGGDVAEDVPEWVPVYPGSTPRSSFASQTPGARTGAFTFETTADLDAVLDHYAAGIERAGLSVASRTKTNEGALLVATSSDESRGLNVMASTRGGSVTVVVNFTEKR